MRGLEDDLVLPALWLIRRFALGAVLDPYQPDEGLVDRVEDRLFTEARPLYDFVQERLREN